MIFTTVLSSTTVLSPTESLQFAVPAFKGTMAEAATKHFEAAKACKDASHLAYEESIKARKFACRYRHAAENSTKKADIAYQEAKILNAKNIFKLPKNPHLTLDCNCTKWEGCKTARSNAHQLGDPIDAGDRVVEHHLRYAKYHGSWGSAYLDKRRSHQYFSIGCIKGASDLTSLADHHERSQPVPRSQM